MQLEQIVWTDRGFDLSDEGQLRAAQWVLVFGGTEELSRVELRAALRARYPTATFMGCSTAGEIAGGRVRDRSVVATAVLFEHTAFSCAEVELLDAKQSRAAGAELAAALDHPELSHIFVLSEGLKVNGSELVSGLVAGARAGVAVTGGLSGAGEKLVGHTLVWLERSGTIAAPREGRVIGIGFSGSRIRVGYGSMGGWDPFGPERMVTKATANVLYELDGRPALELYKRYLGEHAASLPSSALLFPLSLRSAEEASGRGVVRTVLGVDEAEGSMTFAGDLPVGSYVRLMKANFERLLDGANGAAKTSLEPLGASSPELAILISCVGRKLVLKQRIEEEVESVQEVLGPAATLCGFYSYGEISPFTPEARCELHNQTMTITTLSER